MTGLEITAGIVCYYTVGVVLVVLFAARIGPPPPEKDGLNTVPEGAAFGLMALLWPLLLGSMALAAIGLLMLSAAHKLRARIWPRI